MSDAQDRHDDFNEEELMDDEDIRQLEVRQDLGANYDSIARDSVLKRRIFEWIYDPKTEMSIFALIIISILILVIEVSLPTKGVVSWAGNTPVKQVEEWFFYLDVAVSTIFAIEYMIKLWIAPRKWFFIRHNWIDLLAILPILRVFRIGRAVRLLRLLRLLRLIRIGHIIQQRISSLSNDLQRRSAENSVIFIYLLFSLIFGTIGVMVFEKGHNPGFQTLGDGLWWCVVTLTTVGYGDISPKTTGGKLVAGIIMFIGLSFYALLTGVLSSIIIERTKRNESSTMEMMNLTQHVVLCGWNDTGRRLIKDLIESELDPHVVVLLNQSTTPKLIDPNVHYIDGDPSTAEGLEKAQTKRARVAVILADEHANHQDSDARAILTTLAIEQLNPAIHTVAEIYNDQNVYHLKNAGCDEIILSGSYMGSVLSQSVQNPGISDVYNHLFSPAEGVQIYERPVNDAQVGKTFSQISTTCYGEGYGTLIGYQRNQKRVVAPTEDIKFKGGDILLMLKPLNVQKRKRLRRPRLRRRKNIEAPED